MKVKNIIFDFDGTIADSLPALVEIFNGVSEQYGYEKAADLELFRDNSTWEFATKVLKVPFYRLPFFYLKGKKQFHEKIIDIKSFIWIRRVIDDLAENYKLGILTSNFEENVGIFVKKEYIDDFSFIQSGASLFGKHRSLKKMLKRQELNVEECVYVGDELRDVKACKKIGMKIISVTWGFDSREVLERGGPDWIVEEPEDIKTVLESLAK